MTTLIEIIRAPWAWCVAGPLIGLMVPALSSASARRTPVVARRDIVIPAKSLARGTRYWLGGKPFGLG